MNELQIFENYRCLYHQVQYLNNLIKNYNQEQQLNIHNHILNRIKQILNLKDQNYMRMQEILTLSVINCLEDILKLETTEIKELYQNLKILIEYLAHLNEFISQQSQQVLLGDVIIDIQLMNTQIKDCVNKSKQIIIKFKDFFQDYNDLQNIINNTTHNIQESIELLTEINNEIKKINIQQQIQITTKNYNQQVSKQLEYELLM